MSKEDNIIERWNLYSKMTKLGELARRYFVMNFFDGILTVLGVIIGYFITFLRGEYSSSIEILILGLAVSIAIGISGITGGLLTEKAERTKNILDLKRTMVVQMKENIKQFSTTQNLGFKEEDYYPVVELIRDTNSTDLEYIDVDPKNIRNEQEIDSGEKTIFEKAEIFAGIVASLINGLAPAVGGIIGLIPFLFISQPDLITYIIAFALLGSVLFLLGVYLAKISEDRIWKYSILMVLAGVITALTSYFIAPQAN